MGNKSETIYFAEQSRVKGSSRSLANAVNNARKSGSIEPDSIANLSVEELADRMRWWRIWAVSALSLAGKQWIMKKAVPHVKEARSVLQVYYYNPIVWETAKELTKDSEGNEYLMAAEMCRDEASYWRKLSDWFQKPNLLLRATDALVEAIDLSPEGTSAHSLAIMENCTVTRERGYKFSWGSFTEAYENVVDLAPHVGGWDRMAAVSWYCLREAIYAGKRQETQLAVGNLMVACHHMNKYWFNYLMTEGGKWLSASAKQATNSEVSAEEKTTLLLPFKS